MCQCLEQNYSAHSTGMGGGLEATDSALQGANSSKELYATNGQPAALVFVALSLMFQ